MRIAYVLRFADKKGGREKFVLETALALENLGHHVMIFCSTLDSEKAYPRMQRIPHKVLPARETLLHRFKIYFQYQALEKLIEQAVRWGSDVIFLQEGYNYASYFQEHFNSPIVPYIHGIVVGPKQRLSLSKRLYRKFMGISRFETLTLKNLPLILCNSHNVKRIVNSLDPTAPTKVVYPGVNHRKFKPTWEDAGFIYYHSRFQPYKNQLLAIEAVRSDYKLILSGFRRDLYVDYVKKTRETALGYRHQVLTNITDSQYIRFLQRCSIFLFPSRNEYFGITPIEAMACGKPVIGHRSGGTIETVGETGILCGDSVEEWRQKIRYLMENPEARKNMGKGAYQFSKSFTWENTAHQLEDSFRQIIEK